jgi:glycosyltransferase involved in cell wall biosynthesis
MKILYVITGADIGGAQKHVMHLVEWFQSNGNKVEVITGEDGPFVDWLHEKKIPITIIPIPRKIELKKDWQALLKLRKHLKQNQYDVVHCHSSKAGIIGRLAAFVSRVPKVVFTAHGFVFTDPTLSNKKKWFYTLLEKVFGYFSTDIITVSHYDYKAGIEIGLHPKKLHVIHNGLPKEDILPINHWKKKQEDLSSIEKKVVGFVGRLVSEKNVDMLIRIASLFKQQSITDTEFWIIGDGKLEEYYQQEVRAKGLENMITFWGNQTDVLSWMDRMHVQIITSHKEGLPYVLLEAMGRGLPVISTDVGGVKEVLDPEQKLGVIVPINNDQRMFEKLIEVLHNDQYREQLGNYLLEQASECTVDHMCKKTDKIYKKVKFSGDL